MELPEIRFDFNENTEIIANGDGTGILLINKQSDDEMDWGLFSSSDQDLIKEKVREWVDHYQVMENE